jgi:hypothetical protein
MTTTDGRGTRRDGLMARVPRTKITNEEFCLAEVELRGLEPLTPCLQRWWLHPSDLLMPRSHAFGLVRE